MEIAREELFDRVIAHEKKLLAKGEILSKSKDFQEGFLRGVEFSRTMLGWSLEERLLIPQLREDAAHPTVV